ncbi:MAG: DUF1987 domain-containing protein [Cyclobacteriaceae bacterium]|nr:DUF1987 domain-containing protein [Cyclobacteriaceae bacterium HetDA_MAG_MS6]
MAKDKVVIDSTPVTPYVIFDAERGLFEIKGRSSPEVSINFYDPIYQYLDGYDVSDTAGDFVANFTLEYFNTSSTKCLLGILKRLSNIQKRGQNVVINWYYDEDDDDVLEIGEDLSYFVNLEFNFHPIDVDDQDMDFIF